MTARTIVLLDGSNVSRCAAWLRRLDEAGRSELPLARRRLVDAVASWAGAAGVDVLLVFDGAGPWRPGRTTIGPGIVVEGSGGGRSGDELLERAAAQARVAGRVHWVVSSDRTLCHVAGASAERILDADTFVAVWLAGTGAGADPDGGPSGRVGDRVTGVASNDPAGQSGGSSLGGLLDDDVAARLERLRRGEA